MIITNPYKRTDVFCCYQDAHHRFEGSISAHHVLREKKCYPDGCLYFLWYCTKLEKGERCIHKYNFVGKNCKGCTYYLEEKVHLQPDCLLEKDEYEAFLEDLEHFDTWLEKVRYKRISIMGKINRIKPWVEKTIDHQMKSTQLRGYLLVIKNGYIGIDQFKDTIYIRVTTHQMKTYGFLPKMKLELRGEIREDRGRIIVFKPNQFEILTKGWGYPWTKEKALVAMKTATLHKEQSKQCLNCTWSVLIDLTDKSQNEIKRYRELYCLKGIEEAKGCYIQAIRKQKHTHKKNLKNKK